MPSCKRDIGNLYIYSKTELFREEWYSLEINALARVFEIYTLEKSAELKHKSYLIKEFGGHFKKKKLISEKIIRKSQLMSEFDWSIYGYKKFEKGSLEPFEKNGHHKVWKTEENQCSEEDIQWLENEIC